MALDEWKAHALGGLRIDQFRLFFDGMQVRPWGTLHEQYTSQKGTSWTSLWSRWGTIHGVCAEFFFTDGSCSLIMYMCMHEARGMRRANY